LAKTENVMNGPKALMSADAKFNWKGALPKWYMALRVPLTIGACSAVAVTLFMDKGDALEDHAHVSTEHITDSVTDAVVLR
jgi:hypothetical protein